MINNFFLIKKWVRTLKNTISEFKINEILSSDSTTVYFQFVNENEAYYCLKISFKQKSLFRLQKDLALPTSSIYKQFQECAGETVVDIYQPKGDRSVVLVLSNNSKIWVKFYGALGNIAFINSLNHVSLFRTNRQLEYIKLPTQDKENSGFKIPDLTEQIYTYAELIKVIPQLNDPTIEDYIARNFHNGIDKTEIKRLIQILESSHWEISGGLLLATFESESVQEKAFVELCNYNESNFQHQAKKEDFKKQIHNYIQKETKLFLRNISAIKNDITSWNSKTKPKEIADILMANLHLKEKLDNPITLFNFYTNSSIDIKINPLHSLQENAKKYYKKDKNAKIEIELKEKRLINLSEKLQTLQELENEVEISTDNKFLKELIKTFKKEKVFANKPWKTVKIDSYDVYIGKDATSNDLLLKNAKKNDYWFHAKDVTGSHVVLPFQPNPSKKLLENVASVAAWYSKAKNQSIAPVSYTQCKYVIKGKGMPKGAVKLIKEDVILVQPKSLNS